jgi:hypothetical protein
MDFLTQILATTGPLGVGITVIFLLMLLGIKILWETHRDERKTRLESEIRNHEKYDNVVKQMFEVVNANTKAITTNTEITRELNENMRSLRATSIPQSLPSAEGR